MPFAINRTVAVALATIAFLTFSFSRVLFAAPRPSEDAETTSTVQSDDADYQELNALKTELLERQTSQPYERLYDLFDAALQAGEKNPQAAEKLVDFVAGALYLDDQLFFRFCDEIRKAGENESSPFHRDELLEKVGCSVKYEYFMRFGEAYEAEGVAGLEKVLDQYAQDVQKKPQILAFYKDFDDLLTRPEDDEDWKNYIFDDEMKRSLDDDSDGYGRPELGLKLKRIVADAYLRELRSNPALVPMPIDDFLKLFVAIKGSEDAEFIDKLTSIWFDVAFASDYKIGLDYRRGVNLVGSRLFWLGEETETAFRERAIASFKLVDERTATRLVLWGFYLKMKKAVDEEDTEKLDNILAALVEWVKESNPRAVRGGFDFSEDPAAIVFKRYSRPTTIIVNRYRRKFRDFVKSNDFEKLEKTIPEIVALEKTFPPGELRYKAGTIVCEFEVVRPDLAFQVYDEAFRLSSHWSLLDPFYMQATAFYYESIDAILDADLEKLEELADKLAEKANKLGGYIFYSLDHSGGTVEDKKDYLFFQRQTYAWKFRVRYGDSREAREILDRAISVLEKSDKPNAKSFRELLIDVRNDPSIPDREREYLEQLEFYDRAISALEKSDKPNAKSFRELLIDVRNDPNIPERDRRYFEQTVPPNL